MRRPIAIALCLTLFGLNAEAATLHVPRATPTATTITTAALLTLASSTILNMVVVPVLYAHFERPVSRSAPEAQL